MGMDTLHENETKPGANADVDFSAKSRPRAHLPPRVYAELETDSPTARLVGAGVSDVSAEVSVTVERKFTLPRRFREITGCRRFRVMVLSPDDLEFYCLD